MVKSIRFFFAVTLLGVAGVGCWSGGWDVRMETERVSVVRPGEGRAMRDIIAQGAKSRGWAVVGERPGCVSLHLDVRGKHFVRVDIDYGDGWFAVKYVDSGNLNYDASTGEIHRKYIQWVRNLKQTIRLEASNAR